MTRECDHRLAQPGFVVYARRGSASLGGTLTRHNSESDVRDGSSYTIDVTLSDDCFVRELNQPEGAAIVREPLAMCPDEL